MKSNEFIATTSKDRLPILILDLISYCNLKCVMCPQGNEEIKSSTPRGKMSLKLYKKIIDEITSPEGLKVNAILPFWNGEALMHPDFKEMVDYAASRQKILRGFNVFSMHTNFLLADRPMIESIVNSRIFGPITLSIDAATANTYSSIRRGGDYEKLMENIDYLLYYRDKKGYNSPSLTVQFIVMENNFDEIIAFKDKFNKRFNDFGITPQIAFADNADFSKDTIYFRQLQTGDPSLQSNARAMHKKAIEILGFGKEKNQRNIGKSVSMEPIIPSRPPCVVLWQQLAIRFDGECSPCCRDIGLSMDLGNIKDYSLKEIFWGDKLNNIRESHLLGRFEEHALCSQCLDQTDHKLEPEDVSDFLHHINKVTLYEKYIERIGAKGNDKNTLYAEGKAFFEKGEYNKAITVFTKASKLFPDSPEIWAGLGEAYGMIGRFVEARMNLKNAMELGHFDMESPLDAYCFGHSLYKARDSFLKALLLDKKTDYYSSVGKTALLLRNFDEAEKYLLLSKKEDNQDLSLCYFLSGNIKKSIKNSKKGSDFRNNLEKILKSFENKKTLTVLRLGDSHTEMAGRTVSPLISYGIHSNVYYIKIINLGVGGETVSDLFHRMKNRPYNGDIIVIFIGTNDSLMGRNIQEFRENYERLVKNYSGKKLVLVTLFQTEKQKDVAPYNAIIIDIAEKFTIPIIRLDKESMLSEHILSDGLHFDRNGLEYIEKLIVKKISEIVHSMENREMKHKYLYDEFVKTRNTNDYFKLLDCLIEMKRFRTALIIHEYYRVKADKVYAYVALIYQECGKLKRASRMYYKLARRFDTKYWSSLGYCLRLRKKYIISCAAYVFAFFNTKEFIHLKNIAYNILLLLKMKK